MRDFNVFGMGQTLVHIPMGSANCDVLEEVVLAKNEQLSVMVG